MLNMMTGCQVHCLISIESVKYQEGRVLLASSATVLNAFVRILLYELRYMILGSSSLLTLQFSVLYCC